MRPLFACYKILTCSYASNVCQDCHVFSDITQSCFFSLTTLTPAICYSNSDLLQVDCGCPLVSGAGHWDRKREIKLK